MLRQIWTAATQGCPTQGCPPLPSPLPPSSFCQLLSFPRSKEDDAVVEVIELEQEELLDVEARRRRRFVIASRMSENDSLKYLDAWGNAALMAELLRALRTGTGPLVLHQASGHFLARG
jgi:hypothetical protein